MPGAESEYLLIPAQTQNPHLNEGLAAGEVDVRFEKEPVDEFHPLLFDPLLQFVETFRREVQQADEIRHFGEREAICLVGSDTVEVCQVVVQHVVALRVEVHQPPADRAVGIGDDV